MNCPVFGAFVRGLQKDTRYKVLDLGPALPENLDFFSAYRCKLQIADLTRSIATMEQENSLSKEALLADLSSDDEPYDIMLFWDIFNYMSTESIRLLMDTLAPGIKSGTRLHALNASTGNIPSYPNRYRIIGEDQLLCQQTSNELIPSPCHAQRVLEKQMPGFKVQGSLLLKNGIQEFLFQAA